MSSTSKWLCAGLLSTLCIPSWPASAQAQPGKGEAPQVEIVFCLDTTGSMAGLINTARKKIWSINKQIAAGKPTPRIKIGLVAFRDRGDEYVTKVIDLSDDLDSIHRQLSAFKADGGGDEPEDVNKALYDAVQEINWSNDPNTLKMIFLVGDAPPHMDYADELQYPEICKMAVAKDIVINTIQCGNSPETRKYWIDIARLGEGSYVQIEAEEDRAPAEAPVLPPPGKKEAEVKPATR
jgi:Mg-chelatase subunit ChlD